MERRIKEYEEAGISKDTEANRQTLISENVALRQLLDMLGVNEPVLEAYLRIAQDTSVQGDLGHYVDDIGSGVPKLSSIPPLVS